MKRFLFAIVFLTFSSFSFAQRLADIGGNKGCSHAKIKQNNSIQYLQSNLLNNYDVKYVKLDIELERNSIDIAGNASLLIESKVNLLDTIVLELKQVINIDSIKVNNVLLGSYTHVADHI